MENFWSGKSILVTGAGGFIASHLIERLAAEGAQVRAFVRYNSRGDPGLLRLLPEEVFRRLDLVAGDLRDLPALRAAMDGMEVVYHLGALIAIPYSYVHPLEVVETNVIGTTNVLICARDLQVERVVHTSTSEVYGTALHVPIEEDHSLQGQSPYSASKIGADKIAESFYRSFAVPVVTIRPFNTYGPRQSARAVIPTIITQALTGKVVKLGNLEARRDLTYISDTVEGFFRAGEVTGIEGATINLGAGFEISIRELAQTIISMIGKPIEIVTEASRLRPPASEVERLLSDNRLARERLGWQPEISLKDGLQRTIRWIEEHIDHYRPSLYQI